MQPVALQSSDFGVFVLFHPNGVEMHNAEVPYWRSDFKGRFWALSDSSEKRRTPPLLFQVLSGPNRRAWIVQTSFPAVNRWIEWRQQRHAALFIMKSFSEKESKALRSVIAASIPFCLTYSHSSIFDYDAEAFLQNHRKWGGCARTCVDLMTGILSEKVLQYEAFQVAKKFVENPGAISMWGKTDITSYYIFTLSPDENCRAVPNFHVATPYLRDLIMKAIAEFDAAKQASFYDQASGHFHLQRAMGYIFEKYFYIWLSLNASAKNGLSCTAIRSGKAKSKRFKADSLRLYPVGNDNITVSSVETFLGRVNSQRATSFAWIPDSRTQATFDAIIFTRDRIVTIQVTVADKHSMDPKGFEEMEKYLLKKFQDTRIWCHVFVTDRPSNVTTLQKHRYEVAEEMDNPVYAAHLQVSALTLTSDDLERANKVDVSGHKLQFDFRTNVGVIRTGSLRWIQAGWRWRPRVSNRYKKTKQVRVKVSKSVQRARARK